MSVGKVVVAGIMGVALGALACSSSDQTQSSAPEVNADACSTAKLDEQGVCRQANGQFAEKRCCATVDVTKIADEMASLYPAGRHEFANVEPGKPIDMIRAYVADVHEDPDYFTFVEDHKGRLPADEASAGTVSAADARIEAIKDLEMNYGYAIEYGEKTQEELDVARAKLTALFDELDKAGQGVAFGYDGFWQNSCAAPTTMLLVLDMTAGRVNAIDLTPCEL